MESRRVLFRSPTIKRLPLQVSSGRGSTFAVVVEAAPAGGERLERRPLDLRHRLERRHGHPEQRKHHAERARRHQRRRQPAEPGRLQYSTWRRKSRHCSRVTSSSETNTNTAMTQASPSRKYLEAWSYSSMIPARMAAG